MINAKKLVTLILTAAMCFQLMLPSVYAEDAESPEDAADTKAKTLVNYILDTDEAFTSEKLSRAEFVDSVVKLLKLDAIAPGETTYSDVTNLTLYNENIYTALALELISPAESFYPNDEIKRTEALKIAINAAGYGVMAQSRGGFPTGYINTAKSLGILDNMPSINEEALSVNDAYTLLYNMLRCEVFDQTAVDSDGNKTFRQNGKTLLSKEYGIYYFKATVTGTPYNSLLSENTLNDGQIALDGEVYEYDDISPDMLGLCYEVYVREDNTLGSKTLLMFPEYDVIKTIDLDYFNARTGNKFGYYDEEGRLKTFSAISEGCTYIVNGKRFGDIEKYLNASVGSMEFIDNDRDNRADICRILSPEFMSVGNLDTYNKIVGDANGDAGIDLSDMDAKCFVYDTTGKEMHLFDLNANDNLRFYRSEDGMLVKIYLIKNQFSGNITKITSDYIYIDGTEYIMTEYFKKYYLPEFGVGMECDFCADGKCLITCTLASQALKYGYLVSMGKKKGLNEDYRMKIFSASGVMETYEMAKKVRVDGNKEGRTGKDIYNSLLSDGAVKPQLLKYYVNSEQKISKLDFAERKSTGDYHNDDDNYENSLKHYTFSETTFKYRIYKKTAGTQYNLSGTTVFKLPKYDLENDELYFCTDSSEFADYANLNLDVYDMNEYGSPAVAIYRYNDKETSISNEQVPYIIDEVMDGANAEGEKGYVLGVWHENKYSEMFMKESAKVENANEYGTAVKSTHSLLSAGDIVRLQFDKKNNISTVEVVFDARRGVFAPVASNFNQTGTVTPGYQEGKVYSYNGSYIGLSNDYMGNEEYNFDMSTIRFLDATTNNLLIVDGKNGNIRLAGQTDVKQYIKDGNKAHYAVVCQRALASYTIVLYENVGELR